MKIYKKIYLAKHIEGFLTDREGQMLYSLARACKGKGSIVEIGSWKGKSTIWLAHGVKDNSHQTVLFAIDPHTGSPEHQGEKKVWTFDEFQQNITVAGVSDFIKPLIQTSADAVKNIQNDIELLFIDGAHEYDAVRLDYTLFRPLVLERGFIAFHDSSTPGVDQLLEEILAQDGFQDIYFTDSLLVGRKTSSLSHKDRFKNNLMLALNRQFTRINRSKALKRVRTFQKGLVKLARDILYHI